MGISPLGRLGSSAYLESQEVHHTSMGRNHVYNISPLASVAAEDVCGKRCTKK